MARAVAGLPQAERDYFDGVVADARADLAATVRRAKLREMSDIDVLARVVGVAAPDPDESLQTLLDAGFVRQVGPILNGADENRWEVGFRNIVTILRGPRYSFEIPAIVEEVRALAKSGETDRLSVHVCFEEGAPCELVRTTETIQRFMKSITAGETLVRWTKGAW